MKITLPQQHIILTSDLDLGAILRIEQHSI